MAASSRNYGEFVTRVNQVDANELNFQLFSVLKSQLLLIFKYFKPGLVTRIQPELNALLRFAICKYSIEAVGATIGQQLLLLKYKDVWTSKDPTSRKMFAFTVFLVGCHWIKERNEDLGVFISKYPSIQWMHSMLDWSETIIKCSSFINFLIFLHQGIYLSVLDRLFGLRSVPAVPNNLRQLTYEYMTRELLWHGFAEFLTVAIPLLNTNRLRNYFRRTFVTSSAVESHVREIHRCAICNDTPCLPHTVGCSHVFCYYCVKNSVAGDNNWICPACNYVVNSDNIVPLQYL